MNELSNIFDIAIEPSFDFLSPEYAELFDRSAATAFQRSEEHTSELQSRQYLVCRLLLEKKNLHDSRCFSPLVAMEHSRLSFAMGITAPYSPSACSSVHSTRPSAFMTSLWLLQLRSSRLC